MKKKYLLTQNRTPCNAYPFGERSPQTFLAVLVPISNNVEMNQLLVHHNIDLNPRLPVVNIQGIRYSHMSVLTASENDLDLKIRQES